jgi:hypothetical protein
MQATAGPNEFEPADTGCYSGFLAHPTTMFTSFFGITMTFLTQDYP